MTATLADRYVLESRLGEGGMGVVWRARDTKLGRVVAVKVLSPRSVGNTKARARLVREARAAAALEHEAIVRVYDVGETADGGAFLVMELIRGQSLRTALEKNAVDAKRCVSVIVQAARALHFAHQAGVIHRDVKPDNIMIRDDGGITVVDFGVAKPTTETDSATLTAEGALVGTPAYFSPEQARCQEVTAATDQFALAVTAFEALAGELPWRGSGAVEVIASIIRDEPPKLGARAESLAPLDPVLARAMAKAPADRWESLAVFADELERAAGPASVPKLPRAALPAELAATEEAPAPARTRNLGTADTAAAEPHDLPARPASRSLPRTALIAMAAVVLGFAGWQVLRSSRAPLAEPAGSASVAASEKRAAVACPVFAVEGTGESWLGLAASSLACERFSLALGAGDAETLAAAELAGTPRDFGDAPPSALPSAAGLRERTQAAAKARAQRWLDGDVRKEAAGFKVDVTLRAADGAEVARGEGRGVNLFEAVRAAVRPSLDAVSASPQALSRMRESLDVSSLAEALDLLDVRTAVLIEDPVSLKEACAAATQRTGMAARTVYLARVMCARKLRTPMPQDAPPALDDSTPGALVTTALAQAASGGPEGVRARAAVLERERARATDPETRARLAAAAAELYNLIGDERARDLARGALRESPKATDWRTSAWHRSMFTSAIQPAFGVAAATWQPWEPAAQSLYTRDEGANAESRFQASFRAYLLAQRGVYAAEYGTDLIMRGKIEQARDVADLQGDDALRLQVLEGEGKYGAVVTRAPKLLRDLPATDEYAALAFTLTRVAVHSAATLERPANFVELVVDKYVASEPPHVIDGAIPFSALVASCCEAPRAVGRKCIDRLQQLRKDGRLPTISTGADTVVQGAARFVADDFAGAAKIWRTMLGKPAWIQDPFRDVMATAFDKANAPDLGDEVDAVTLSFVDSGGPADLAWVRAARRAQARGDEARARKLAAAVVQRWRFTDEDVPSVAAMKALVAAKG